VALGVWILLYALGLALGVSSVDLNNPGSARSAGIGTGIWSLIAPLVSLFVGGLVASRAAGVEDKMSGAMHGAVLWGLTTLVGVIVMGMALSSLLGAVFNVGKTALEATGAAIAGAASEGGQQVQQGALKSADTMGRVFWGVFSALLFGLASSLIGATLGVSKRQHHYAGGTVIPHVGPRHEVYP
jgi:hypothetical protein